MKNKAGKFVTPTIASTSAAAAGVTLPADYRVSITNADGDTAYPISTFTYLILQKSKGKCSNQTPLVDMLWWAYHDKSAQSTITELNYAPLPTSILPKIEATLKSLKCDDGSKTSLKGG
jgi:phosphate transport system substrate-binding protein